MHALAPERLQAAQSSLASMRPQSRVWEFVHPETACLCRAEYDGAILQTEVTSGPVGLDADDWDDYAYAITETLDDLDKAGLLRTAVSNPQAAERELRLVSDVIREIV